MRQPCGPPARRSPAAVNYRDVCLAIAAPHPLGRIKSCRFGHGEFIEHTIYAASSMPVTMMLHLPDLSELIFSKARRNPPTKPVLPLKALSPSGAAHTCSSHT